MAVSLHSRKMRMEQLKRYNGSILDHTSSTPKDPEKTKFKFKKEYIFLTVCASDDIEEVERLLEEGVDINTANVDGLTALHQACLNQRMDVVKCLVEHSADVSRCDNDGWTPLHAASSTDNIEIASYLINNGSKLDVVSFDGELPVDVTQDEAMVHFLSDTMAKHGIDSELARSQEEKTMREDAEHWLNTATYDNKNVHPLNGASPLHIAAARGYVGVLQILLKAGANVNAQDYDGWTPMHAAAHWGHKNACQLLVDNLCDLSIPSSSGLLAEDVVDPDLGNFIEKLKEKQVKMSSNQSIRRTTLTNNRRSRSSVSRLSFDQKQMMVQKSRGEERAAMEMMLAIINSRTNLTEGNMTVFDVDEEKEEDVVEEVTGSNRNAENSETVQNDVTAEKGESKITAGEKQVGESIPEIDSVLQTEQKNTEAEILTAETSTEILQHQDKINGSKNATDADTGLENETGSSIVTPETEPLRVSDDVHLNSLLQVSGHLLSSATAAALRELANSHRWSIDDPKKEEDKENTGRSRVMLLRKERLEKRRSIQGELLQAADCIIEEELSDAQMPLGVENEEVTKMDTVKERHSIHSTQGIPKEESPQTQPLSSITDRNQDITLTLYRRSAPLETTIPFEEDDINAKAAALARARRKGRLSSRAPKQENVEEAALEKENQDKPALDLNETKSLERSQIVSERLDRFSSQENISENSSLSPSSMHLPSAIVDICHQSTVENESIDYKKLYENERFQNEKLSLQNKHLQQQLNGAMLQLDQIQETNRNINKEKRDLERRISELEAEIQTADELKSNNERLKMDNAALVRVIGHLSKQTTP